MNSSTKRIEHPLQPARLRRLGLRRLGRWVSSFGRSQGSIWGLDPGRLGLVRVVLHRLVLVGCGFCVGFYVRHFRAPVRRASPSPHTSMSSILSRRILASAAIRLWRMVVRAWSMAASTSWRHAGLGLPAGFRTHGPQPVEQRMGMIGEIELIAAPVAGLRPALNQAAHLQLVDQPHQGHGRHFEQVGELRPGKSLHCASARREPAIGRGRARSAGRGDRNCGAGAGRRPRSGSRCSLRVGNRSWKRLGNPGLIGFHIITYVMICKCINRTRKGAEKDPLVQEVSWRGPHAAWGRSPATVVRCIRRRCRHSRSPRNAWRSDCPRAPASPAPAQAAGEFRRLGWEEVFQQRPALRLAHILEARGVDRIDEQRLAPALRDAGAPRDGPPRDRPRDCCARSRWSGWCADRLGMPPTP